MDGTHFVYSPFLGAVLKMEVQENINNVSEDEIEGSFTVWISVFLYGVMFWCANDLFLVV